MEDEPTQADHKVERVDRDPGGRYILQCRCGWRSGAGSSAAAVGAEWDEHVKIAADHPPNG